ncbi:MAG: hypothetical protein ACI89X_001062 [Planctomycetota bacterium]|jgi:hypothetical protein
MIKPSLAVTLLAITAPLAAQWQQTTTNGQPGVLRSPAIATTTSGLSLMFGGDNGTFPAPFSSETWSFASDWQLLAAPGPSARYEARMVYDSQRSVFVMYGGWSSPFSIGSGIDETWEFGGGAWTQAAPTNTPGGLWKHAMCYDSNRNVTVLFGGSTSGLPGAINQTWEYNGITWTQITPTGTPGPRENAAMCFDTVLGQSVMFGGNDPFSGASNQTWIYNGNAWLQIPVSGSWPSARAGMEMVYDPFRAVSIMSGGVDSIGNALSDTWEFNGLTIAWTQVPTTGASGHNFGMTFNASQGRTLRYGGFGNNGETWHYGANNMQFGVGCLGSNGTPALDAPSSPRLGLNYALQCANMLPNGFGAFVLSLTEIPPTPLGGIGMTGCTAYMTPDLLVTVSASGVGVATWTALIPNNINLLGVEMFAQGLSIDPGFNPAWLVSSNAHVGLLGF